MPRRPRDQAEQPDAWRSISAAVVSRLGILKLAGKVVSGPAGVVTPAKPAAVVEALVKLAGPLGT